MRGASFALLALVASALAAENVVVLTPENFDQVVDGSRASFVEFYAPWCGHCKALAPEYEILGETFAKLSDKVVIAKVDCDAHKDVCSRFGVTGYPTLKFFPKGVTTNPDNYEGGRTADDIVKYINGKVGTSARVRKAPSAVTDLDGSNFDKIALDPSKHALVEFYAPWCGHCKRLAPDYEKLAAAYAGDAASLVIAKVDCDAHKDVCGRYGVTGFPTLKWFPKDNKESPESYDRGRDIPSFVAFLNEKAGTQRDATGRLLATAGRISALDAIAARFAAAGADFVALLKEAEAAVAEVTGSAAAHAKTYLAVMKRVAEKGKDFVAAETQRVERLLAGSVTPAKADELTVRKNILGSFVEA
jgi:protein disulfide-isomerase A6